MQKSLSRHVGVLGILVILAMILAACPAPAAPAAQAPAAEAPAAEAGDVTLTIATVNNPDMKVMEELSPKFTEETGIKLEWVVLPENELRAKVTTDVATGAASFDIVTVGTYEVPIWGTNEWLHSIDELATANPDMVQADYDFEDLLPAVKAGLSTNDQLYAVPFYGESSFLMYNKKMFDAAGLTMPEQPTWEQVAEFACQLHDPANNVYGIALRGLPGWGEVMAPLTTVVNTFGGRWFDEEWMPQLDSPEWNEAVSFYADLVQRCGPPGVTGNGFTESLTLMANTLVLSLSVVIITFTLGMIFALLLNRPFPGRSLARTLLISPFLVMPVVTAVLWKNVLLNPSFGLAAYLLSLFGLPPIDWLAHYAMPSVIMTVAWQWTPFVMLILLAGLQSLPESTLEAASLDGATGLTLFRYIILPHLRSFIEIALLMEVLFILNIFGEIFVMTTGGPGIDTTNLPFEIYKEGFLRWNVSRAAAFGVLAVILANMVVLLFLRVLRNQNSAPVK